MKRILVVDDESLIRYSLAAMLQSDEVEVKAVPSGAEALAEVHGRFYDLCFLDIHLPDMNGFDIMREIRTVSPGTAVILMTASEEEEEAFMQDHVGNREYFLSKPFDLFQVKAFVDRILSGGTPLCHDERLAYRDYTSFMHWFANDQRRHERKAVAKSITCLEVSSVAEEEAHVFSANVVDICDGGVGIVAELELSPGRVIRFFDRLGACQGANVFSENIIDISDGAIGIMRELEIVPGRVTRFFDRMEACMGVVRWSRKGGGEEGCRAGVQFVAAGTRQGSDPPAAV